MRILAFKLVHQIRASYWFVPSVMVLASVLLAAASLSIDRALGTEWVEGLRWLMVETPEGARTLLGAIASSMMTVAGSPSR